MRSWYRRRVDGADDLHRVGGCDQPVLGCRLANPATFAHEFVSVIASQGFDGGGVGGVSAEPGAVAVIGCALTNICMLLVVAYGVHAKLPPYPALLPRNHAVDPEPPGRCPRDPALHCRWRGTDIGRADDFQGGAGTEAERADPCVTAERAGQREQDLTRVAVDLDADLGPALQPRPRFPVPPRCRRGRRWRWPSSTAAGYRRWGAYGVDEHAPGGDEHDDILGQFDARANAGLHPGGGLPRRLRRSMVRRVCSPWGGRAAAGYAACSLGG